MPLRPYIVILILLFLGLWPGYESACASGAVDGGILYGVGQYHAEVEGAEVRTVSTNYQQVSLRYKKDGELGDARAGKYTLMLGYELSRIAPRVSSYGINDPDFEEITAKKPFYQASLLIAPGGLPFRLNLFARDLHRSTFVDENSSGNIPVGTQANNQSNSQGSLIDPKILTGINNGTHREFGGTLLLGIRNGSYLGLYRDVLSQLPRLLVDYKQVEVRDLSRDRNRQHARARDLAFVSLNKLDNWVHFRMRDYTDFINPESNVAESQVIIGLVDQLLARKWINMTNWLQVSGDLSYNVIDEANKPAAKRSYVVNMMAIGQQQHFTSSAFSSFNRTTDGRTILLKSDLPINVTTEVNRDTRLRSRLIYQASERSLIGGAQSGISDDPFITSEQKDRDCYLDLQLEMFRSRRILVVPRFEVESRSERDRDGLAMRIGSEVHSNPQLSQALNWLGGYALTASRSDEALTGGSLGYFENMLYGRVDKEINRTWRAGGDASLASGSGAGRNSLAFRIPRMASQLQSGGGSGKDVAESSSDGSITRGDVTLYLEHRHQRLENRVEFSAESVAAAGVTANQLSLQHALDYNRMAHRLKWRSIVNQGDNSGAASATSFNYLNTNLEGSASQGSWSSNAKYSYDPSRSLGLTLDGAIGGTRREQQQITYALSEKLVYRLFTTNGVIRRIAEFSEELGYEKTSVADVNGRDSSLFGRFSAAYFPTRYIYGKFRTEITSYPGTSALQQVNAGELGLDYEKLKLVATYTEGKKNRESATLPEVTERLWNVEVRKVF
jgi:hypothetical protein